MTEINEKLAIGLNELLAKRDDLEQAESYYTGQAAEVFASPQVKKALSKAGSWTLNFSAIPVKAVAERLEILAIKSDTKRSTKALNHVFTRNKLNIELNNAITDTLVYGHSYLTVAVNHGKIDVFSNSPYGTHAVYRADNPRVMDYAVRLWEESDGTYRANLYTADRIYRFSAHTLPAQVMPQSFELIEQAPNPYGQIPVFELRTSKTAEPEHKAGWDAQQAIHKFVAAQMSSSEYYSFPARFALAGNTEAADFADTDAPTALSATPGTLTILNGFDSVTQLDSPKPDQYIEPIDFYIRSLAMLTSTPLTYFQQYMKSNVSGDATRATESAFYRKCRDRKAYIDAALHDLFGFVLSVSNLSDEVIIEWAEIEAVDHKAEWETRYKASMTGLPVEQILREAGYSDETVNGWKRQGLLPVLNPETNRVETRTNEKEQDNG